jgi:superfamily II DNA or RNA helicase
MKLRKHQKEFGEICIQILEGKNIKRIYADITPGGGKSALPVIAGLLLMAEVNLFSKLIWVVPRTSLQVQGEAEFMNPIWEQLARTIGLQRQPIRIRAANNDNDPCRGTNGYITTYQAVSARACLHHAETTERTILFLDEPHHVSENEEAAWHKAMAPMVQQAGLVVFMSGTFSRGDGKKISFVPYDYEYPDRSNNENTRWIRFSRDDAITEKAIIPAQYYYIPGHATWEKEDKQKQAAISTKGQDASSALHTALRTEYAFAFLDLVYSHWIDYVQKYGGKLLIVAPNIKTAKRYLEHMRESNYFCALLATSDQGKEAQENIKKFKTKYHCLVTVAMAYEGLNVPSISHMAILTNIRSVPWLEQCIGRANRVLPGKSSAHIFLPDDQKMIEALNMIEGEQGCPLAIPEETKANGGEQLEFEFDEIGEGGGQAQPRIIPIGSRVTDWQAPVDLPPTSENGEEVAVGIKTTSEQERELREEITYHVNAEARRRGLPTPRAINSAIKKRMGKSRMKMDVKELQICLAVVKEMYPMR